MNRFFGKPEDVHKFQISNLCIILCSPYEFLSEYLSEWCHQVEI
jgi:hypothetical protein